MDINENNLFKMAENKFFFCARCDFLGLEMCCSVMAVLFSKVTLHCAFYCT